jgi:hypothetical protein
MCPRTQCTSKMHCLLLFIFIWVRQTHYSQRCGAFKMEIRNLIPKDKFDTETAGLLKRYSYYQIKPIVNDLLTWIQDMHWPVASLVFKYLEGIAENLTDEIIEILESNDDIWKFNCLRLYYGQPDKINERLLREINRIALRPTKGETEEDVQELAIDLIERIKEPPQQKI